VLCALASVYLLASISDCRAILNLFNLGQVLILLLQARRHSSVISRCSEAPSLYPDRISPRTFRYCSKTVDMTSVDQLDPLLQALQALKPPGASKTKIAAITNLAVENVQVNNRPPLAKVSLLTSCQSESVISQRLYRHFKRTPGTHKLGVLYVVDSVTRQWIEKARQSGQDLSDSSAPDGSFASGVHKITELLPALIDDLIQNAPTDHKVCLS